MISCWCAMLTTIWLPPMGHVHDQCCAQILFEQPVSIGCIVEESYKYNLLNILHTCTMNACISTSFVLLTCGKVWVLIMTQVQIYYCIWKSFESYRVVTEFSLSGYYHASKWKFSKICDVWDQRVARYSTTMDVRTLYLMCILVHLWVVTSQADQTIEIATWYHVLHRVENQHEFHTSLIFIIICWTSLSADGRLFVIFWLPELSTSSSTRYHSI